MARNAYTPEVRDAFMKAALEARESGKKFPEVYEAAKEAGYKGSLQGIAILVRKSGAVKKRKPGRPRKEKAPAAVSAPVASKKRGRGRPRSTGLPAVNPAASIETLVADMVRSQVQSRLQRAIEVLQQDW